MSTVTPSVRPDFGSYVMAVDRVEKLLRRVVGALEARGIEYAVIGGNAVAAWVSTVDRGATRATQDVDLLVRRTDVNRIGDALRPLDLILVEVLGVYLFVDRADPNPKYGVHLVFANEIIRPHYVHPAPDPSRSCRSLLEFQVINLAELVVMKLQSNRLVDRTHLADMIAIGLITPAIEASIPRDLTPRLEAVRKEMENE
ncbi:MAG: hypothetical protein BroJett003_25200 [Planctomycetota bacterium]|nr:MAG: hypothetical protein BroJett003_25200 [Planctomycetota bacterium]